MAIFIKDDIILPKKTKAYVEGLVSFSDKKIAVSSQYSTDNKVAKIDRATAQIRIFRTVKRDDFDRLYPVTRSGGVDKDHFRYHSIFTSDVYDLKILLAICALGKAPFAKYLHPESGISDWVGLGCDMQVSDILKFIDRRNDPENREPLFASLVRLCAISIEAKIHDPKLIDSKPSHFNIYDNMSGRLIKILERGGDKWIKIGLFWTLSKEAWIDSDNPRYAPISMQEVHALSRNDIAMLLLVFFRSHLGVGVGSIYRYDDIVRLVRGEDGDLPRIYPTQGVTNSRYHHHSGPDRQSVYTIKAALKLIDERTDMKIYKDRDPSRFVVVRPVSGAISK